jgi:hypothetical protein
MQCTYVSDQHVECLVQYDLQATRTSTENTPNTHTPHSVLHGKACSDSEEESALFAISPRYRVRSLMRMYAQNVIL